MKRTVYNRPNVVYMHTVKVICVGFLVLGLSVSLGYYTAERRGVAAACLFFVPLWFACASANMYQGVKYAGYSFAEELPLLVLVVLIPSAVALLLRWKLH